MRKEFFVNTREITKMPHNQHSSQKVPTQRFGDLTKRRSLKCCHGQVLGVSCQGMDLPMSHTVSSDGLGWTFQIIESSCESALLCHLSHWSGLIPPKPAHTPCSAEKGILQKAATHSWNFLWSAPRTHHFLIHQGKLAGPQAAKGRHRQFQIPVQMMLKLLLYKIYAGV